MTIEVKNGKLSGYVPSKQFAKCWLNGSNQASLFLFGGWDGLTVDSYNISASSVYYEEGTYSDVKASDFNVSFSPQAVGAILIGSHDGIESGVRPTVSYYGIPYDQAYVKYQIDHKLWKRTQDPSDVTYNVSVDVTTNCDKYDVTVRSTNPGQKSATIYFERESAYISLNSSYTYHGLHKVYCGNVSIDDLGDSEDPVSGSSAGKDINVGNQFKIKAEPAIDGWEFHHWKAGGDDIYNINNSTDAEIVLTSKRVSDGNCGIIYSAGYTAVFVRKKYRVDIRLGFSPPSWFGLKATLSVPSDGMIDGDPSSIGGDISFPVGGYFYYGSIISITGTSSYDFYEDRDKRELWCLKKLTWRYGYEFYEIYYYDDQYGLGYRFFVVEDDIDELLSATYREYSLNISVTRPEGGSYTVNGNSYTGSQNLVFHLDDTIIINKYPNPGWGVFNPEPETITFTPCDFSEYYSITFYRETYNVTVNASPSSGGCIYSIDASGQCLSSQTVAVNANTEICLRAKAANCYKFTGWTGAITSSSNPTYLVVNADATIVAVFEACSPDPNQPLMHRDGNIIYDCSTGMPIFRECDCCN